MPNPRKIYSSDKGQDGKNDPSAQLFINSTLLSIRKSHRGVWFKLIWHCGLRFSQPHGCFWRCFKCFQSGVAAVETFVFCGTVVADNVLLLPFNYVSYAAVVNVSSIFSNPETPVTRVKLYPAMMHGETGLARIVSSNIHRLRVTLQMVWWANQSIKYR